jgi:hypothetical protein
MRREAERILHVGFELRPCRDERLHEPKVTRAVISQIPRGQLDGAVEDYSRAIIQRVRQRRRGMNPFQAAAFQWQAAKKRGPQGQGVNGRADVVHETGQRQFFRSRAAADRFLPLDQ